MPNAENMSHRTEPNAAHQRDSVEFPMTSLQDIDEHPSVLDDAGVELNDDFVTLPLLGRRTLLQHQRILGLFLILTLLVLAIVAFRSLGGSEHVAQQVSATGQSLMQSQRLAKSASQALLGVPESFKEVKESSEVLSKIMEGLKSGDEQLHLEALSEDMQADVQKLADRVQKSQQNAAVILSQEKNLTNAGAALGFINKQSFELLEIAESIAALKMQQNSTAIEISAAGQLVMLTQRIGKSSNEFLIAEGVGPETVFVLGKDLTTFKEIALGLLDGNTELRLSGTKNAQTREQLLALIQLYEQTRQQAAAILGNLQSMVSARQAQQSIFG